MPRVTDHPKYGERALQLGSEKGLDIWWLQAKLIGWGSGSDNDGIGNTMDPVRLTGEFDATTRDAVLRFQKAHQLPLTGIVDATLLRAIDREAALHPVLVYDLKCPCSRGDNDGPILCRCTKHDEDGKGQKCDGFGKKRFAGKFLLDGIKLADDTTDLSTEKLDVYDKQEYDGVDKVLLWAVRAVLCRARTDPDKPETAVPRVKIAAGYQCWWDNYHHTDDVRWHHRRLTFHLGKAVEFVHPDPHTDSGDDPCEHCDRIREVALNKCGFQLRWQQSQRVSVAEGEINSSPPTTPFAVHLNSVRLHERKNDGALDYTDQFVKADGDAIAPLYEGKLSDVRFPVVLAKGVDPASALDVRWALDPKRTPSVDFFNNIETGPGGWFPVGLSRMWHGGVHIYAAAGTEVRAIADGEIVGCRAGDPEEQPNGSRNFVLIKHTLKSDGAWNDKEFYSLYLHLDEEKAIADATVAWRKRLFYMSKDYLEPLMPAPIFEVKQVDNKNRLFPKPGLDAGEIRPVAEDPKAANQVDDSLPAEWKVVKLAEPADHYFFTEREKKQSDGSVFQFGAKRAAVAGLTAKLTAGQTVGLEFPIKVAAGELLGKIAKPAKPAEDKPNRIAALGSFLHLETFSAAALPVDKEFVTVEATEADKAADRKEVIAKLVAAKLLPQPLDGVLLESELKSLVARPPFGQRLRSAVLHMPSAWSLEWKDALKAKCFSFLKDDSRDSLATDWDTYCWWKAVKDDKGKLPADEKVYHYHPIALILQIAYAS